jgi:CheY-like chemotaxis protein
MSDSATPKRILFIDDEPALLDSLTRVMRPLKSEWDVHVESSPRAALDRLATETFDVVVTDMRLPVLDGVPVVSQVMERSKDSVRMMLSTPADNDGLERPRAQFFARAGEIENMKETIERISRMRDRMHDDNMRALIGEIDGLPAVPAVCHELTRTLAKGDFSMRDVASVVEKDPALVAKILQLVNSPFFGLGRKLTHVHDAVAYLGTSMVKNLVTSLTLWRALEGVRPAAIGQLQRVHTRCHQVAGLCRRMMGKDRVRSEEAFVNPPMLAGSGFELQDETLDDFGESEFDPASDPLMPEELAVTEVSRRPVLKVTQDDRDMILIDEEQPVRAAAPLARGRRMEYRQLFSRLKGSGK